MPRKFLLACIQCVAGSIGVEFQPMKCSNVLILGQELGMIWCVGEEEHSNNAI